MAPPKPSTTPTRRFFIQILSISLLFILLRLVYIATLPNTSSTRFISQPNTFPLSAVSGEIHNDAAVRSFHSSRFQDFISQGLLSLNSKSLCLETRKGECSSALKDIGVNNSIGVQCSRGTRSRFRNFTFDFVFSGNGGSDGSSLPFEYAAEIGRVLKGNGIAVVHTNEARDLYSLNSLIRLFECCMLVRSRKIEYSGFRVKEIIMKKVNRKRNSINTVETVGTVNKCAVTRFMKDLVRNAEPLIEVEPLRPWSTLKRNLKNIKYLPSIVDISFKRKYVYVDVGARSYGSSIGSWFRKQYPKQNRSFEIYAIEADKAFHEEYKTKKNVKLLPYAAWLRNETLFFEINRDPVQRNGVKRRGMGRIQTVESSFSFMGDVDKIVGFDFAHWLKNTVSERDFVVMKMDVEGTEFDLIPKLFETGAICLIDEIFLECHYNRWQKCCPGKRSPKFQKTYGQCLELFSSLRKSGVLVHQWW